VTGIDRQVQIATTRFQRFGIVRTPTDQLRGNELNYEGMSEFASHLQQTINLLDPSQVVIGGGLSWFAPLFLPLLTSKLSVTSGVRPNINVATFGTESSLYGARLVALRQEL
jgi:predicted NBD/HSP70 family sugar kinase